MRVHSINTNKPNKTFGIRIGDDYTREFITKTYENVQKRHTENKEWLSGNPDNTIIAQKALTQISNLINKDGSEPYLFIFKTSKGYIFGLDGNQSQAPFNSLSTNQLKSNSSNPAKLLQELANKLASAEYDLVEKSKTRQQAEKYIRRLFS